MRDVVDNLIFAYNYFKAIEEMEESDFKEQLLKSARLKRKKALKEFMTLSEVKSGLGTD